MGPLVPYIISEEFGLVIALAIGVAFGFVLEQGGFSSTKKLVGLFYGYDFTVLRVFFTAGITAMAGVLLLGHYGILDTNVVNGQLLGVPVVVPYSIEINQGTGWAHIRIPPPAQRPPAGMAGQGRS